MQRPSHHSNKGVLLSARYQQRQKNLYWKFLIIDADAPHNPRGCVAQAWAVAEVLRVMKEYELCDERIRKTKMKDEIKVTF